MVTCRDCIHLYVCPNLNHDTVAECCPDFKDHTLFVELPCKPGTHLWRITTPYRGEPKVTEFVVKNFRTAGKRRQVQIEVQAVNVPGTNWMRYQDFFRSPEEAKKALMERRNTDGDV